jgi:hypothetical protein
MKKKREINGDKKPNQKMRKGNKTPSQQKAKRAK